MKNSHISKKYSIPKMAAGVFSLSEPDRRILKYLALHGPLNLNQIERFTTSYSYHLKRWAIKNRLYGSSRFLGLIPYDFVFEIFEDKHRFGKQEKKYHLALKGILASCADIPIEKNYFFKEYIMKIPNLSRNPKLNNLISQYIAENIKLLIAWYSANGYQFKKRTNSGYYDQDVLQDFYHTSSVRFLHPEIGYDDILPMVKNCVKLSTVFHLLGGHEMHTELSMVDPEEIDKIIGKNEKIKFPWSMIFEWPLFLGNNRSFPLEKQPTFKPDTEISYRDLDSNSLKDEVDKELKKLGISLKWH